MQALLLEDNGRKADADHSPVSPVLPLVGQRMPWPRAGLCPSVPAWRAGGSLEAPPGSEDLGFPHP